MVPDIHMVHIHLHGQSIHKIKENRPENEYIKGDRLVKTPKCWHQPPHTYMCTYSHTDTYLSYALLHTHTKNKSLPSALHCFVSSMRWELVFTSPVDNCFLPPLWISVSLVDICFSPTVGICCPLWISCFPCGCLLAAALDLEDFSYHQIILVPLSN